LLKPWPQLAVLPARSITPEMMRDVLARMIKARHERFNSDVGNAWLHSCVMELLGEGKLHSVSQRTDGAE